MTRWFVPGRIEVLGKHTDYAGGRSLLCAVERGFSVTVTPGTGDAIAVRGASGPYAATVLRRFGRNFPHARRGGTIALESTLPSAAGLSSSSALIIAIFLGLAELNDLRRDQAAASIFRSPEALAGYLATVENGQSFEQHEGDGGVGTFGGSEDHTAIVCGVEGALSQYAFCPVRHERTVQLDPGWTVAIAVSGIRAHKTGTARGLYNGAVESVRGILEAWREATGRTDQVLAAALASGPDAAERLRQVLSRSGHERLLPRLEQFIDESDIIVPSAARELAEGNMEAFGALADRSQALAERALGNQVPETIHQARAARSLGATAASAFGAGFGGSVWALVRTDDAPAFVKRWTSDYGGAFPAAARAATFFCTRPGPAAHRLE